MVTCYGISKNGKADPNYFETSLFTVFDTVKTYENNEPDSKIEIFIWNMSVGRKITKKDVDNYFKNLTTMHG